jgi:hypothetical protein
MSIINNDIAIPASRILSYACVCGSGDCKDLFCIHQALVAVRESTISTTLTIERKI